MASERLLLFASLIAGAAEIWSDEQWEQLECCREWCRSICLKIGLGPTTLCLADFWIALTCAQVKRSGLNPSDINESNMGVPVFNGPIWELNKMNPYEKLHHQQCLRVIEEVLPLLHDMDPNLMDQIGNFFEEVLNFEAYLPAKQVTRLRLQGSAIYVPNGVSMGSYLKLEEIDYQQVATDDGGQRYYKSFVSRSRREGSPCWVVQMPEVWPNQKVLQLEIKDKMMDVALAFTGEHLTSVKFSGKRTFDLMEEIVRAWDLAHDDFKCSFRFVYLAHHIEEKDWNKPIEEVLGLKKHKATAKPRPKAKPKAGAMKAMKKPAAKK
eukprot:s306_g2.t1